MKGKISLTEKPTRKHSKTKKSRREAKLEPLTTVQKKRKNGDAGKNPQANKIVLQKTAKKKAVNPKE